MIVIVEKIRPVLKVIAKTLAISPSIHVAQMQNAKQWFIDLYASVNLVGLAIHTNNAIFVSFSSV